MMRASLQRWINSADTARHLRHFEFVQFPIELAEIEDRLDDYYISLVGQLFSNLRAPDVDSLDWAQLGNALLQFARETTDAQLETLGISKADAALFSAASFYFGGFPASAYLVIRHSPRPANPSDLLLACFDFLARPAELQSDMARHLQGALEVGALAEIDNQLEISQERADQALQEGPEQWIVATLMRRFLGRFSQTNVRAVLPEGWQPFWTPLVQSLVNRQPSTWEFFPSQIQAINSGLLANNDSYAMQMPTGAGKTTLCETLLFWHLSLYPDDAAVLLVPFRSLASELRGSLVRRLNALGLQARCVYGGTVPSGEEIHSLDRIRAMVATPESLSGILSAEPTFSQRISLVICDEGHLLDSGGRGIGLELLLARVKSQRERSPRFVFMSAIVPNIDEINAWLGGNPQTVIRSDYRPATAEFAVLRSEGAGAGMHLHLDMHPHEHADRQFTIDDLLTGNSFRFRNPSTGRLNTYSFSSIKTRAVAVARKVLTMGAVAIFAANKRGNQGAVGLAGELVAQLERQLPLPDPRDYAQEAKTQRCIDYLDSEFGAAWIGTKSLRDGAVLHHGDIPQEAREVLEELIRGGDVRLVICTSTLAEGVNLPIRSLVLYSVQRRSQTGRAVPMLERDIKNLIGRAGRAGANTKGLIICANPDDWQLVEPVALQGNGESVQGSLRQLIQNLSAFLVQRGVALSNELLEINPIVYPVIDGVDSTLIDLIAEEVGEQAFLTYARELAEQTFAARTLPADQTDLLRTVFELRARRLINLRNTGKLEWVRESGARVRLLESVESNLMPARERWDDPINPMDDELRRVILEWAWTHRDLRADIAQTFRLSNDNLEAAKRPFFEIVQLWMAGTSFFNMARLMRVDMGELLSIHSKAITFSLQTLVEQGLSLLARRLLADDIAIAEGVLRFTEQLRFGAPNLAAQILASTGVRHRKAYVALSAAITQPAIDGGQFAVKAQARQELQRDEAVWRQRLGELVFENSLDDLS